MDFDISTIMMFFFILFMIIGIWKIYVFLPNKQLPDDDTTKESQDELLRLMIKVIKENSAELSESELFYKMKEDEDFNKEHFWRFNQNRLEHLLEHYFLTHHHVLENGEEYPRSTDIIKDIWHVESKKS